MKKQTKKGFTLVELVIVIAVIAILSAILIPTFGNVISEAKENAAREDARTAYQQFLMDHKENAIVTSDKYEVYILVEATGNSSALSASTYTFCFKKGAMESESVSFSAVATNNSLDISASIEENKAYALAKKGMYIVFKTNT